MAISYALFSDIYGMAVARKMVAFKGENADYKVSGYVSLPEMTRASKNYMTLIVNGRWVKSYAVTNAVSKRFILFYQSEDFRLPLLMSKGIHI